MVVSARLERLRISRSVPRRRRAVRRILRCDRRARRELGLRPAGIERRAAVRTPLHVPIYLYPAQVKGLTAQADLHAQPILAVTRNISFDGIGWVHDAPIPLSRMIVEFDVGLGEPLLMLVEVLWTTQEGKFAFRSGGRILGICRRV